jgi:molybdopterin molybdotransferase
MNIQTASQSEPAAEDCCSSDDSLLPVDLAISKGLALAAMLDGHEITGLYSARGRIIQQDIYAVYPLPNFDNSAMDGYALNTELLDGTGPFKLEITGRMAAGDANVETENVKKAGALRILTGAAVPAGYDSVIMQEKCTIEDGHIIFEQPPRIGANIRTGGSDCAPGDLLVAHGTLLEARHIALLAAQGISEVKVCRKVRVAFFSTGSELKLPGETLASGQIFNSNRYTLAAQLDQPFIELLDLGTVKDDQVLLKNTMQKAVAMADMVITTGGVSVGDEDHMPGIITELGGTLHVMKVAIKPGKPVTIGTIGQSIFLGLPGNPVAAYVNQMLIGRAIVEKLAGIKAYLPTSYPAIAGFSRKCSAGRQEYVPALVTGNTKENAPIVEVIKNAGSANLVPLAHSDGFVIFPIGLSKVDAGDIVQFIPHGC